MHQHLSVFGAKITLLPRVRLGHHYPLNSLWLLPSSKFRKLGWDKVWVSCPTYKGYRNNLPSSSSPSSEKKQGILARDTSVSNQGSGVREVADVICDRSYKLHPRGVGQEIILHTCRQTLGPRTSLLPASKLVWAVSLSTVWLLEKPVWPTTIHPPWKSGDPK